MPHDTPPVNVQSELGTVAGCLTKPGKNPGGGVHDIHFTPGNPLSVLAGVQVY